MRPADLSSTLVEFLASNDLDSSQAPKVKDNSKSHRRVVDPKFEPLSPPVAAGAADVTAPLDGQSEEDRALAEAIALSMLDHGIDHGVDHGVDNNIDRGVDRGVDRGDEPHVGSVDALAASLQSRVAISDGDAPTKRLSRQQRHKQRQERAAAEEAPKDAAAAAPTGAPSTVAQLPEAHLPEGWEAALRPEPAAGEEPIALAQKLLL